MSSTGVAVCVYGPTGLGKSSDQVAAFPNAFFIGQQRALMSSRMLWGFEIPLERIVTVQNLREASAKAVEAIKKGLDVVLDDMSPLAEYSEHDYATGENGAPKLKGYDIYKAVIRDVMEIRHAMEFGHTMFACSAHLGQPRVNSLNQRPIRGGPRLPGQAQDSITTAFDTIVQIEADPMRQVGYQASFICRPTVDASFAFKDRHNIADTLQQMPPNTRELLTAAGYKLQRPKGLEWMDTAVANIAQSLIDNVTKGAIPREALYNDKPKLAPFAVLYRKALEEKYKSTNVLHQNWVLRDAVDRALITLMLKARRAGAASPFGG